MPQLLNVTEVEALFPKGKNSWKQVGGVAVCLYPGITFGIRRYEEIVVVVETTKMVEHTVASVAQQLRIYISQLSISELWNSCIVLVTTEQQLWAHTKISALLLFIVDYAALLQVHHKLDIPHFRTLLTAPENLDLLNPFTWSTPCTEQMFFGREKEIRDILFAPASSFAIIGPRRIGKSSLLHHLRVRLNEFPGQNFLLFSCGGIYDFAGLIEMVLQSVNGRAHYKSKIREYEADKSLMYAISSQQARYIIALDEFDSLTRDNLNAVRALISSPLLRGRCRFIVAGSRDLWEQVYLRTSPLFNLFRIIQLRPFERNEAFEFVRFTLGELSIPIASDIKALWQLVDASGGQPSVLQYLCSETVEYYSNDPAAYSWEPQEVIRFLVNSTSAESLVGMIGVLNTTPLGRAILFCVADSEGLDFNGVEHTISKHGLQVDPVLIEQQMHILQMEGFLDAKRWGSVYTLSSSILKRYAIEMFSLANPSNNRTLRAWLEQNAADSQFQEHPSVHYFRFNNLMNNDQTIEINNSQFGVLNAGDVVGANTVSAAVSGSVQVDTLQVQEILNQLSDAIQQSSQLTDSSKAGSVEQISELRKQAELEPAKRLPVSVLKAILLSLATTIGAIGGVAEIWSTWGTVIMKYFGI